MDNKKFDDDLIDVSDKKDINIDIDINVNKSNNFKNNYNLPKSETNISKHDNSQSGFQNNRPINPYNNSGINKLNDNKKLSSLNNRGVNNQRKPFNNNLGSRLNNINDQNNVDQKSNQNNNGFKNNNVNDRGLKQGVNSAADRIRNAPQNIKDKINDTKDKVNNTKEKIKNTSENVKNKANNAKEKWNNRPKSFNEFKDRAKSSFKNAGPKLADKAKQGVKKTGQKALDEVKDTAKEKVESSSLGQAVNKTKDVIDKTKHTVEVTKKAFKAIITFLKATFPWLEIILVILLFIFAVIMLVNYLFPGLFGDVKKDDEYDNYADVDQKTLEKMKDVFNKHSSEDATLAMATVVFPYYTQLHDGNVSSYLTTTDNEDSGEEDPEVDVEEEFDGDDVEKDEGDQEADDMYLLPFRNSKVRKRLGDVLDALDGGQDSWESYLKDKYFKNDKGFKKEFDEKVITGYNGYKKLFEAQIDDAYEDNLEDAIIKNLQDIKDFFLPYIFDLEYLICSSESTNIGYSDAGGIIQGEAYVIIKDTGVGNPFSTLKNAPDLHGTGSDPLTLKRYVMGVSYAEIGDEVKNEHAAKADMIASKSFVLGRIASGAPNSVGMGYKYDVKDGKTYFYMRGNTSDQDFCDIYEGCKTGRFAKSNIKSTSSFAQESKKNVKDPLPAEDIANLEKWYDEVAGEFIYNESMKAFGGSQYDTFNKNCVKGYCLSQKFASKLAKQGHDYKYILYDSINGAFSRGYVVYNMETQQLSVSSTNCVEKLAGGCSIASEDFIYYSQRQYNDANVGYCGRVDPSAEEPPTISTSGCGVTSMAMIISNLTDEKLDPLATMNEAANASSPGPYCGEGIVGTKPEYYRYSASKHGITYSSVLSTAEDAEEKVKTTLNSGGLVIANVGKGWQRKDQGPVEVGHYLVIRGVAGDGSLLLADPMLKEASLDPTDLISFADIVSFMKDKERYFFLFTSAKSDEIKEKYCGLSVTGEPGVATGHLGNPLDPNDTTRDFSKEPCRMGGILYSSATAFPRYCSGNPHGGVDLSYVVTGTPIYAMDGGVVSASNDETGWGKHIIIDHGNGHHTVYAHFSSRSVQKGENVAKGQLIGYSGNSGNSTGEHLHIELWNDSLYSKNGRDAGKYSEGKGLMNPTKYINSSTSYVGQTR